MQIKNVAIIGSGTMGTGIVQTIADSGFDVTLWARNREKGLTLLHEKLQRAINKGTMSEQQANCILSKIQCTSVLGEAVNEADIVIETVVEDVAIKKALFKKMDIFSPEHAILASNTSSLSICSIADATKKPEKVIGMHFFNPAPVMKLVEVVQGSLTSKDTIDSVLYFSEKIHKVPLIVKDTPGFIVNRCLIPLINEAAFILMEKTATAETIDSALKLGANHPLGPLALADLIGIDVCLETMRELQNRFGNSKYRICPLIKEMVAQGNLGRKTGQGFFTYKPM